MTTTEFQAEVNKSTAGPAKDADLPAIVTDLADRIADATRKAAEIGVAAEEIAGLRNRLISEAEGRWMRTRYATIDMSFTERRTQRFLVGRKAEFPDTVELKRRLGSGDTAAPAKTELIVDAPVFACLWNSLSDLRDRYTDESQRYGRGRFEFRYEAGRLPALRQNGVHYREAHVSMSVKMPDGITPQMFLRVRRCMAYLAMFDAYLIDRGVTDAFRGHDRMQVGVLWAPADDAWTFRSAPPRPAGDPAILVSHAGQNYLVGYFDTPDKKPIDNLIREFSRGKVRGKVR